MTTPVQCPSCRTLFEVPRDLAGKYGFCPRCKSQLWIGALEPRSNEESKPGGQPSAPEPEISPPEPSEDMRIMCGRCPGEFKVAVGILYAVLIIGLLRAFLDLSWWQTGGPIGLKVVIFAVTFGVSWFFIEKIRTCRNWARITTLVLFILGIPFFVPILLERFADNIAIGLVDFVLTVLQIAAFVLLFRPKSNLWFWFNYCDRRAQVGIAGGSDRRGKERGKSCRENSFSKVCWYLPLIGSFAGVFIFPVLLFGKPPIVFQIFQGGGSGELSNLGWASFKASVTGWIFLGLVAVYLVWRKRGPVQKGAEDVQPAVAQAGMCGLSGWLIFLAVWFQFCPVLHFVGALQHMACFFDSDEGVLAGLAATFCGKPQDLEAMVSRLEVFVRLALCVLGTVTAISLFGEGRGAPSLATSYALTALGAAAMRPLMTAQDPGLQHRELVLFWRLEWQALLAFWLVVCITWIPYLFRSKRVRETFFLLRGK